MVSILLFTKKAFTLLALSLVVSGLTLPKQQRADSPGFIKLDFDVVKRSASSATALSKRSTVSAPLLDDQSEDYLINLNVGTPPQPIQAVVDTGSSDFWVAEVDAGGNFTAADSSTYQATNTPFSIQYISGSTSGYVGYDTVSIPGGPSLENFQLADITINNASTTAILGIGFEYDESLPPGDFQFYPNFPAALKNAGYISKNAYSIYLNDLNATAGAIIFGGIDNSKYESLATIPFTSIVDFQVSLAGLSTPDGQDHSLNVPVVLDTGTTFTYLPLSLIQSIADSIPGAVYNATNDNIVVPKDAYPGEYLTYHFSGVDVKVPLTELVTNNFNVNGTTIPGNALRLGSGASTQNTYLLGDSFLRSAYVVFDLDAGEARIGQVIYSTESSITAL